MVLGGRFRNEQTDTFCYEVTFKQHGQGMMYRVILEVGDWANTEGHECTATILVHDYGVDVIAVSKRILSSRFPPEKHTYWAPFW